MFFDQRKMIGKKNPTSSFILQMIQFSERFNFFVVVKFETPHHNCLWVLCYANFVWYFPRKINKLNIEEKRKRRKALSNKAPTFRWLFCCFTCIILNHMLLAFYLIQTQFTIYLFWLLLLLLVIKLVISNSKFRHVSANRYFLSVYPSLRSLLPTPYFHNRAWNKMRWKQFQSIVLTRRRRRRRKKSKKKHYYVVFKLSE